MIKKRKVRMDGNGKRRVPFAKDEELNVAPPVGSTKEKKSHDIKDEEENKLNKLKASQNLKLLQYVRLKKKGINADNLSNDNVATQDEENENKVHEKHFTKNITEKEIEEAHIENFIRKNMDQFYQDDKRRKGKRSGDDGASVGTSDGGDGDGGDDDGGDDDGDDPVKDLYKLSDHLKVKSSVAANPEKLNCITGITEVPLPIEVKLKNIEETEKIKRKLLKKAKLIN
ncbi:conserved Plasmodium protein, unknown function [Plasmodium knowlesi strain H]|uniref:Telomere length and silencing protein 1 n=3 Tax=Plasmodium knowlesi TaxID=5850 RepID=A0A5K1VD24_PLAKH|nr:telomere length and silencing protein 1, putative [Plasmodium knowlesi strain H]OTN65598.1 Uncharacterized protein PKNOH_S110083400 [Plasmodium knowlesi]CAA9989456.1 telomere length and silencing protein 1, putative [Plasmodium knowlesi strain H]SBO25097.1 conserved Plasmodium protein, unknown function [Plasmodium knowlesi strain H]SBO27817.1 conserved Plasmodium protein, unknown function [Plasmodium knowlesi strain H]VVS78930.1 telomere length and silencing protein 1, putative [Plasmodium |eukprot:XP_002260182.1 hypothetical protein, conserved in Plasmodium species [Plasmodium knowlesi strain H]